MNQIYKIVWNASLGAWVAVSELAKNKTKTRTVKSIAATILLGVAIPAYADVIAGKNITVTAINGDTKIETTDNPNFSTVTATGTIKGQTLESTGAATVGNGLTVTAGTTSLKDTTVNGVLNTTGAVNANSLNVTGNTTASNITASGMIKGQTLESTGAATVGNGLTVTAGTTSLKNTTINGTLSTSGIASLNGGASLNNKIINNLAAGTVDSDAANYAQVKAAKTQIAASGKNTSITSTTGSDGQTIYTVNTIDNPNFTSVTTTGAVTVGNGLTVNSGATSLKNTSVDGTLTTSGVASLNGGADLNSKQIKNLASATTDGDAVNLGQIKSLLGVNDPSVTYNGIKYFRTKSINADAQANGDESVAIGPQAKSDGLSAISIGDQALASADSSISIGKTAKASAAGSISLGEKSLAYAQNNVAIGKESSALGLNSTAIGATTGTPRTPQLTRDTNNNNRIVAVDGIPVTTDPNSTGQNVSNITAINNTPVTPAQLNSFMSLLSSGANLSAGKNSLTVGTSNLATGDSSASIGAINAATGNSSTAVGSGNKAIGSSSIAIGDNSIANGGGSTAIGKQASSNRQNAVAIGSGATADTDYGISIGQNAGQGSSQGTTNDRVEHIAIGKNAGQNVVGNQNIAIGSGAGSNLSPDSNSSSDSNIAIGIGAGSGMNGDDNISVGRNSNINGGAISRAITLGSETKGSSQSVVVGTASKVNSGTDATIVGYNAQVNGSGGVAIGSNTVAAANNVALGTNSNANLNSTKNAYLVPDTIANVASVGYSIVSVGNGTTTRRITNLAPGGSPTDAVNVSQLTQLHQDVSTILGLSGSTDSKFGTIKFTDSNGNTIGTYNSVSEAINAMKNATGGLSSVQNAVTYTNSDQNNIVLGSNGGQGTTINNVATATTNDQAVNLGQVKALTKDATVKYVSINSTDGANISSDQAVANNSLAIGPSTGTSSTAENSIALGSNVRTEAINSIAIGNAGTRAKGSNSIAIGKENTTADINNIALGTLVSTKGTDSIGIGKNVQTDATNNTTNYAVAIGSEAEVQNADQAIVVGRKAIVSGDNGIAFGNQALTQGEQGIAIGRSSLSSAQNSTAIGNSAQSIAINANALGNTAKASGQSANAIGDGAIASGQYSTALGTALASADNTTAIGKQAATSALNAIAVGTGAKSEGQQAIALGQLARAYDESSIATGTGANAYKKNTIATGTNSNAYAEDSIALGADATVNNTHNNAVALGSNSISGDYNQTIKSTINGKEYSYAGAGTNLSTVSIGDINKERQIINVAAGRVSSTSTDAINGSQLFQTNEEISNLANKTAQALGGGAVSNQATGGISAPSYTVTTNPAGNGSKVIVNNVGAALSALDGAVNQAIGFAGDTGNNASRKLGETLNLKGGASGTLTTSNIGVVANGSNQLDIRLAESINLGTNGSVTTGSSSIKNNEVKVGLNSLTNSGLNIGNVSINSTANTVVGLNNTTWNPAGTYNSGRAATEEQLLSAQNQLNTTLTNKGLNFRANTGASDNVKLGETITLADGTNTTAEYDAATNTYRYNVIANPTFTTVTTGNSKLDTNGLTITNPTDSTKTVSVTGAGINAGNNKISNLADGLVAANSKEAVNGGQLNTTNQNVSANTTNISNLQNQTFKLQANNDIASSVKSTDTVKFTDGKNVAITRTGNEITVATKDTVNFDKVTVGNITLDKTTNKISGVAAGAVTSTSTEAINGSQLYGAANNVKNIIGGATTIDTATGALTTSNIGGTGQATIDGAITTVKGTADTALTEANKGLNFRANTGASDNVKLGETITLADGTNTTAEYDAATNTYRYNVIANPNFTTVTTGNSKLDTNGLTITNPTDSTKTVSVTAAGINAGNNKISNLADGVNTNDAINKGQLDKAQAAATTSLQDGKNISVTTTTNTDGSKTYVVATKDDVNFDKVTVGNITLDKTTNKISGVAAGAVTSTSTEAINGSQLYGAANNVKNIIGGNTSVNATTGAVTTSNIGGTGQATIDGAISRINTAANAGWTLSANNDVSSSKQIKPNGKVNFVGDENLSVAQTSTTDNEGNIKVNLNKDIVLNSVTTGNTVINNAGVSIGNTQLSSTGLTIAGGASVTTQGINAGNQKITGVANGVNAADAVNKAQLDAVQTAAQATDNAAVKYDDPSIKDKVTLGGVGSTTPVTLTNVNAGQIKANSTDAINGSQLYGAANNVKNIIGGATTIDATTGAVTTSNIGGTGQATIDGAISRINTAANAGWTLSANNDVSSSKQIKPNGKVNFVGDENLSVAQTSTTDNEGNIKVNLNKDIVLNSVTTGNTVINNAGVSIGNTQLSSTGLTIAGGASVTTQGINAGNQKITGVANGVNAADAVNKAQLDSAITSVNSNVSQLSNSAVQYDKNADGSINKDSVTLAGINGTKINNVANGTVAVGSKDAVNGGQLADVRDNLQGQIKTNTTDINDIRNNINNINNGKAGLVQQTNTNADIVVAKNTGGSRVNVSGTAGDRVVTGVADGAITASSKDAVNGAQLNKTNQYIATSLGGGAKYDNGGFVAPSYKVGDASYNNVGDAVGALNDADKALSNRITNLGDQLQQAFYTTNKRIDDVEKRANAGIASAMALEAAPFVAGKLTYAVGAAYHGGENAVGATLRRTADNGRWAITGGVAAGSQGDTSFRVGISGVID